MKTICRQWAAAFRDFRHLCELQYLSAVQAEETYTALKGDELNQAALMEHIASINVYTGAGSRLPDIRTLLTGPGAAHDAGLLLSALYGLKYSNDEMEDILPTFADQYKKCRDAYYAHLYELVRLHDELNEYVKGKQLNQAAAKWVQGYLGIFAKWARNGSGKEIALLQETVVRPVLALNRNNPGSPFIHVTTENALQCTSAFDNMTVLDARFRRRLRQYTRSYRKALRFLAVVAPHMELPLLHERRPPAFVYALWLLALMAPVAACLFTGKRPPPAKEDSAVIADTLPPPPAADARLSRLQPVPVVYGLDVSRYQGRLIETMQDYDSIFFIICKATEGVSLTDEEFAANWQKLSKAGVLRGAYHFFISSDDPVQQAEFFMQTIGNISEADIPLIIDVEAGSVKDSISADSLQNRLLACLNHLEKQSGRKPVIYTGLSFADTYLRNEVFAAYPLWLAEYSGKPTPTLPLTWKKTGHTFWQKSASYMIGTEKTDYDVFNGNGAQLAEFIRQGYKLK